MHSLIESIYKGAIEESPWSGFLTELREVFGALATTLILDMPGSSSSGLLFSANTDAAYERKYIKEFWHLPFVDLPINKAVALDDVIDRARLVQSSFYRELLEPANTEYILGINVPFVCERVALLRISRSRDQGTFGAVEKLVLESLAEHLYRALPVYFRIYRLTSEREVFGDALDQLHIGAILLDRRGGYLHANSTGRAVLEVANALALRENKVIAAGPAQAQRLALLIDEAVAAYERRDHAHCGMLTLETAAGKRLQVLLRPSTHHAALEESELPAICLFVSSAEAPHIPSIEAIRELFGLTRTESLIVVELLAGKMPKEIALKLDSSLATVRTHIKSIFLKAGVRRQADLLVAILRSVAPLA